MKRFNTDRIRQRMREQNEKLPNSKGKLLSSAPLRIPPPPQTDKENAVPVINKSENTAPPMGFKAKKPPQLTIAVTMDENEVDNSPKMPQNDPSKVSDDDEDNNSVPSVWAMMEHYQGTSKGSNGSSDERTPSKRSPAVVEDVESGLTPKKADNVESNEAVRIPSKIHWLEDDEGELVQSSFYTNGEVSEIGRIEDFEASHNDLSTVNEDDKSAVFRRETGSDQAVSPIPPSRRNEHKGAPTPARVRNEWIGSEADDDLSTNPESLLQESMIQSIHLALSRHSRPDAFEVENDIETQMSLPGTKAVSQPEVSVPETTPAPVASENPVTEAKAQEANKVYLERLGELESTLKVQQSNTDQVQGRLKERVLELEQALKASVATPRGTIVDENPLKTLLDRNQTLVKEVRFADQTCVELSSKIRELEMRNERLQKQVSALEDQKDNIERDLNGKEDFNLKQLLEKEAKIMELEEKLTVANANLRAKDADGENLRTTLVQAFDKFGLNDDALGLSSASSIVSDNDVIAHDHSIDSHSVNGIKTLQQQLCALVERAKMGQQMEETAKERDTLRSENDSLKIEVRRLRDQVKLVPLVLPKEGTKLKEVQKENEFLGRQLGMVQDKLDEAQVKLVEEQQKSESLRMHVERGVETYRRLIEPLERRLVEVTEFNPKHEGLVDVDQRLFSLEKEMAHVKASITAMKRESDRLLSAPSFNFGTLSDADQEEKIISMVQATISRVRKHYKQLEGDVDKMVEGFSDRLDNLSATVSHLRSSLLFEKDSVCSDDTSSAEEEENDDDDHHNGKKELKRGTANELASATIPYPVDDEDELLTLMEEARSPRTHDISINSDMDDISRLLNDDMTLESMVRSGSVFTSGTNIDMFRESLEAAMNECKRVRERSSKLKEQIESQVSTIQELEQENGKLSLSASRRNEEYSLLENALEEAKEEIDNLQATVELFEIEKDSLCQQLEDHEREGMVIREENERLTKSIVQVQKDKEGMEGKISECEKSLALATVELESASASRDDYKKRFDELQSLVSSKISKVTEQNEFESAETRRALQMALHQTSELKRLNQEATIKLSNEVELKLKLESQVKELQNSKLQAQSELEDRDLETQFACEDMRKERAELKHKLSQSEIESSKLKESYSNFKSRVQLQLEERNGTIKKLEAQKSSLLSNLKQLNEERNSFLELLQDLGCCEDLAHVFASEEYQSDATNEFESAMKEIACWRDIVPLIGDEIEAMFHTSERIPDLESEIETLQEDLSKREIRETDQMKHAEDQSTQNEKLFDLLRQAEEEMERSTLQIKDMSEAMGAMQQREFEATNTIKVLESELSGLKSQFETSEIEKNEDLNKIKRLLLDTSASLDQKDSQILELSSEISGLKSEIDETSSRLRSKESEENALRVNIETCEKKNTKLREYIRRLTTKCEEWETSYERQARAIDRLQEKNARMKDKACDIAGRYRALAGDVKRRKKLHQHDREKWSHERSNLNSVHAALEQELEQIAKELA